MNNPFALFDLPVCFELDQAALSARYLALQKSLHPDNFAHSSPQEQRLAMQKSAEINDALQILKDPISRADSIIAIHCGEHPHTEEKSNRDMTFLMQQMAWREALDDAENAADLQVLEQEVQLARAAALQELEQAIDQQHDYQAASASIQALMFMQRFASSLQQRQQH